MRQNNFSAGWARSSVIQRYQGELMKQTGPSCWIYVVEGVADAYQRGMGLTGWDTSLLAAIINLYPRDMNSREAEFGIIEQYFRSLLAGLRTMATHRDRISRDHIEKLVGRVIKRQDPEKAPNITKFMQIFFPQAGDYRLTDVISGFASAEALARELKQTIHDHGATEGALLGGRGMTYIGSNDRNTDIGAALRVNLARPGATMGVRRRLKPRDYPGQFDAVTNTYDLTTVPLNDIQEGGYHAVLLVSVNEGGRTLVYKDPNYGNASIRITFDQLKRMAVSMEAENQLGVELQSFTQHGDPLLPGILARHGRVPVMVPLPPQQAVVPQAVPAHRQPARQQPARQQGPRQGVAPVAPPQQIPQPVAQPPANNTPWYQSPVAVGLTAAAVGAVGLIAYGASTLLMKPAHPPTPFRPPQPPRPPQMPAAPPVYRPANAKPPVTPLGNPYKPIR